MAVATTTGDTNELQTQEVEKSLDLMTESMVLFSSTLQSLYSVNQVTSKDESTQTFLQVRDDVRKYGIVYVKKVLPVTEDVVRSIMKFTTFFVELNFEDWCECFSDLLYGLEAAKDYCDTLKEMHNKIIVDLKKNENFAKVGLEELETMIENYNQQSEQLERKARDLENSAARRKVLGSVLAPITLGASVAVGFALASNKTCEARSAKAESEAKKRNALISEKATKDVKEYLIPSIQNFIIGLDNCREFLADTREKINGMKERMEDGPLRIYYKMLQKPSGVLYNKCSQFLCNTDQMRNNMAAIPEQPDDKNYIDRWFEREMKQIEKERALKYR